MSPIPAVWGSFLCERPLASPLCAAEPRSRIRKTGEHCLSPSTRLRTGSAGCAASGFGLAAKGTQRAAAVWPPSLAKRGWGRFRGPFAQTQGPRLPGRNPAHLRKIQKLASRLHGNHRNRYLCLMPPVLRLVAFLFPLPLCTHLLFLYSISFMPKSPVPNEAANNGCEVKR